MKATQPDDALILDTSFLIDIGSLGLEHLVFQLRHNIYVTFLTYYDEFLSYGNIGFDPFVSSKELILIRETPEELVDIYRLMPNYPRLTVYDCSSMFYAMRDGHILVTGDMDHRKTAIKNLIEVHGTIWFFDKLVRLRLKSPSEMAEHLKKLMQINPRLPKNECEKRLKLWRQSDN